MTTRDIIQLVISAIGIALMFRWIALYSGAGGGGWMARGDPEKIRVIRRVCAELLLFGIPYFALAFAGHI